MFRALSRPRIRRARTVWWVIIVQMFGRATMAFTTCAASGRNIG
jgi:hypothetical protein